MSARGPKKVLIYVRLSVASSEESVSLARQEKAARAYAQARGWMVVDVIADDGVSASHVKPEARKGWIQVLDYPDRYEAVITWKVDRLARKVLDFLHADEALQARGAGLVCVEDPIDMTTPQGRAFAIMLAVFAEMEAAAIKARVADARRYLVRSGRVVGGTVPFGWRSVANPSGPGLVLTQDPTRAPVVREMAERVLRGDSVYSVQKWLNATGVAAPAWKGIPFVTKPWVYSSVERLLRHPLLAGMTPFNPGNDTQVRGDEVLRDEQGLPVIDASVALLTTAEWRRLLSMLDERETPQSRPRASKGATSPLLSGLVWCGECDRRMHRGTTTGRATLTCRGCYQTISRNQLDPHVLSRLRSERGITEIVEWSLASSVDSSRLGDVEAAIRKAAQEMTEDDADVPALSERLANLKEQRAALRDAPSVRSWRGTGRTVSQALDEAYDDDSRRTVLAGQVDRITVSRGKVGRYLDTSRVTISWADQPQILPDGTVLSQRSEHIPGQVGEIGGILLNLTNVGRESVYTV